MLELAWPWVAASALLPLLVAALLPPAAESSAALRVPFFADVASDAAAAAAPAVRLRTVAMAAVWMLMVLAACRPQWVESPRGLAVSGRALLLALDVSASMGRSLPAAVPAAVGQTRLQAAQRSAVEFIERRRGDQLGLVLFGSGAYLQCPLTFDRATLSAMIGELMVGVAGELTALGDAIGLAVKQLRELPSGQRVLILLTDGANTSGALQPLDAARLARHHDVRIYTIGVGAGDAGSAGGVDHSLLREIAAATGGRHFRAEDVAALQQVYRELDDLEPVARAEMRIRQIQELYPWPLLGALLLLALVMLGGGRFRHG